MVADQLFGLTDSMPIPNKHKVSKYLLLCHIIIIINNDKKRILNNDNKNWWWWHLNLSFGESYWLYQNENVRLKSSCIILCSTSLANVLGHVNNIPAIQFFTVISRKTQSKLYILSFTECVWNFQNNALWDTHLHALLCWKLNLWFFRFLAFWFIYRFSGRN